MMVEKFSSSPTHLLWFHFEQIKNAQKWNHDDDDVVFIQSDFLMFWR